MNYTIGDFIIQIKNAALARQKELYIPFSNAKKAIGKVLVKEGFLENIKEEEVEGKKFLYVKLRYQSRRPTLTAVEIISKPSLRVYVGAEELASQKDRSKTVIISTNQGVISGKQAIKSKIGGELLFRVW